MHDDLKKTSAETALLLAVIADDYTGVAKSLQRGASSNGYHDGLSLLHIAVIRGARHAARMLVLGGADVNATDELGNSVLVTLVSMDETKVRRSILRDLLLAKPDVSLSHVVSGRTALEIATRAGHQHFAAQLTREAATSRHLSR